MKRQMERRRNAVPAYRMDRPFETIDPFEGVPYTRLPMPSQQDAMFVQIKSPLGPDDLLFDAFEGREALSELFEFHVRLYSPDPSIDFKKLLGKNLSICVRTIKDKTPSNARFLAGIVSQVQALPSFVLETTPPKLAYYNVTLRPPFWLSTLGKGFRVFMKKRRSISLRPFSRRTESRFRTRPRREKPPGILRSVRRIEFRFCFTTHGRRGDFLLFRVRRGGSDDDPH